MSLIHCKLPNAGLGNQLFPIVNAYYFGKLNNLPVITSGYHRVRIGPYLRGEKSKRKYSNYFTFQKGLIGTWLDARRLKNYSKYNLVNEPALEKIASTENSCIYEFNAVPHWSDYFARLKDHRKEIIEFFYSLIRKDILNEAMTLQAPCIGVHIRMGDFRKLQAGEDFGKSGAVRTPEIYFIEMIKAIREINGSNLPVSVFTDGYRSELKDLLSLDNITMIEGNRDIVDMLLLSRSKIIITSAGSTFSYWSAFLADVPVVRHSEHLHQPIRPLSVNAEFYEGPLVPGNINSVLEKNIKAI
jgi:hypothetical protein